MTKLNKFQIVINSRKILAGNNETVPPGTYEGSIHITITNK